MGSRADDYVPGHSPRELERLISQARMVERVTRRFFVEAGLGAGMRVLDVGSGVGDVAFLAATLVGESGEVVGIDRSESALSVARDRAASLSLTNIHFEEADLDGFRHTGLFDAVVGRYVLMYQPDVAAALRRLAAFVAPGGVMCFHEPSWASARSYPPVARWDRCCAWVAQASTGTMDFERGSKLHVEFLRAGLPAPTLRSESIIGAGANAASEVEYTTDVVVALQAHLEGLGVLGPHDIDPDTLADEVFAEVAEHDSVVVGRTEIGAWSRI